MYQHYPGNFYHPPNLSHRPPGPHFQGHWYPNVPYQPAFPPGIPGHGEGRNLAALAETRKSDQEFLEQFVDENQNVGELPRCSRSCKISETKTTLLRAYSLNEKLSVIAEKLENENLPEVEWQEQRLESEGIKGEMEKILETLRDEKSMRAMKKSLSVRMKKRLCEKRKREEWKLKKEQLRERRIRLHNEADNWIKNRRNVIDKEKQEENLRKHADAVLFDVRQKRNDAKKFQAVLRELENLRRVKVTIAKARGEHVSSAAEESFNNIIVKLMEQWTQLDREYSLEEQGLKLMIKTDNELKMKKQKKTFYDDWETVLFGKTIPANHFLQGDSGTFITMRTAWDRFISADGSPIPIGWVMPDSPSSSAWQKCLKKSE